MNTIPKPARGPTPVDHSGKRFGRLVALEYVGRKLSDNSGRNCANAVWRCICDCGNETSIIACSLVDGTTKSCGCFMRENRRSQGGHNRLPPGESALNQLFYSYCKSAKLRGHVFELSREEFRGITSQPCHYCGAPPVIKFKAAKGTNGDYYGNGVDRIDNEGGYTIDNSAPCCTVCNNAKGRMSRYDFADWIIRVFGQFAGEYQLHERPKRKHGETPWTTQSMQKRDTISATG